MEWPTYEVTERQTKGPFTLSRIASRIIPDLNPGCSGVRHHDFFSMPVWIRSKLVYTRASTVSPRTDKGSNADHAGNAYGANTDFKEEHGGYWVLLRSLHGGVRCLLGYLRNVDGWLELVGAHLIYGIHTRMKPVLITELPVSTRTVPDVFGGYTEVRGAYREEDGLFHPWTPGWKIKQA